MLPLASFLLMLAPGPGTPTAPEPTGLVAPSSPDAIVGGDPVEPGEYPAVVSVTLGSNLCTGTLLTPELVITAAHCLDHSFLPPSLVQVGIGEDALAPSQPLGVTSFGVHPEFCDPSVDEDCDDARDYAWIRLEAAAVIDEAVIPAVVTDEALYHRLVRRGAAVELVGFGEDDDARQGLKRKVTTTIRPFSESGLELLAGASGRDSCRGDSGGPALARLPDGGTALVGVLSRGSEPCGRGGIYGAPLPALCWIRDETGMDVVPAGCEGCDCVDLTPRDEDEGGCAVMGDRPAGVWWLPVVVLVAARSRRRDRSR